MQPRHSFDWVGVLYLLMMFGLKDSDPMSHDLREVHWDILVCRGFSRTEFEAFVNIQFLVESVADPCYYGMPCCDHGSRRGNESLPLSGIHESRYQHYSRESVRNDN